MSVATTPPAPLPDLVNHPPHYRHPSGIECISVTRQLPFGLGNAVKYLWRAGEKGGSPADIDLAKARWYLLDTIDNTQHWHLPATARGLLLDVAAHDNSAYRSCLLRLIAYGHLGEAVSVIDELIGTAH